MDSESSQTNPDDDSMVHSATQSDHDFALDPNAILLTNSNQSTGEQAKSQRMGRYRLIEKIGQGGMGVVWRAMQVEPLNREVAIKVVREEIDSNETLHRFEAERQAIALMDHANIAKILDAGATESGQPFFAMELVRGEPLDKFCQRKRLSIRQRLELMLPVCLAVQHAHQKGIIHRDLKHSNVIVSESDSGPIPKVIDFGLAKALSHQTLLTDKTMYTEAGQFVGTLQYMSPEQTESTKYDIDTRSDIFSLGAMLYKLVVGKTPIQTEHDSLSIVEMLEFIREKDPVAPSEFVNANPKLCQPVADACGFTTEKLSQTLKGDIDSIVLKALEKDRQHRYDTANGLGLDIRRFLNNEPVLARPKSAWNTFQKFVKRNRGLVASLVIATLLLIAGIVGTSTGLLWALKASERASRSATAAKASEAIAVQATALREKQLESVRMKLALSEWFNGDPESAWQHLNQLEGSDWVTLYLKSEMSARERILYGHVRQVTALDVSSDGKRIVTGGVDDTVRLWDFHTGQLLKRHIAKDSITDVCFEPGSHRYASADRSNDVTIFSAEPGTAPSIVNVAEQDIARIAFLNNRQLLLASFGRDTRREGSLRIRDPETQAFLSIIDLESLKLGKKFETQSRELTSLATLKDGNRFVVATIEGNVLVYKFSNEWKQERTINADSAGLLGVAISPNGNQIATCGLDKTGRIWDANTGKRLSTLVGHTQPVQSITISPDGKNYATASIDRQAIIWDQNGKPIQHCRGHFGEVNAVKFTPDNRNLVTVSDDQTTRIWELGVESNSIDVKIDNDQTIWSTAFSPDQSVIAAGGEYGLVTFIDPNTGFKSERAVEFEQAIVSLSFWDNETLIAAGDDGKIHLINVPNRKVVRSIEAHKSTVWSMAISPDRKILATASADATLKLWNTRSWEIINTIDGHEMGLASVDFSPNGKRLLTASDDKTVRIWDVASGDPIHVLNGHTHQVWRAKYSPTQSIIASSGFNGELPFWNSETGKLINKVQAHNTQIAGLTFTRDGSQVVTASDDKTIKFWDVERQLNMLTLKDRLGKPVIHVQFSDDERRLVSSNFGSISIHSIDENAGRRQFLPQEAVELLVRTEQKLIRPLLTGEPMSVPELKIALETTKRCTSFYPSFDTYRCQGIAEYRLGQYANALKSLEESMRLESIHYGMGGVRPIQEGYLALAYFKTGNPEEGKAFKIRFDEIRVDGNWEDDQIVTSLRRDIEEAATSQ